MIVVSKTKQEINNLEWMDHNKRGKYAINDTIEEIMSIYGMIEKDKIEKVNNCVRMVYDEFDEGLECEPFEIFIVLLDG